METQFEAASSKRARRSHYMHARKGLVVLSGGLPLVKPESSAETSEASSPPELESKTATQSVATQSECSLTTAMSQLDINTTSTSTQTIVGYNVNEMFDIRKECLELLETRRLLTVDIEWLKKQRAQLQKEVLNLRQEMANPYTDLGWKIHRPTQAEQSEKLHDFKDPINGHNIVLWCE